MKRGLRAEGELNSQDVMPSDGCWLTGADDPALSLSLLSPLALQGEKLDSSHVAKPISNQYDD